MFTVTAVDAQGNPVPGFLGTVYLSFDRQTSIPYTFTAADAGTLTISSTELALTQGAHTVTAAAPFMSAGLASVDAEPGHFSLVIPVTSVAGAGILMTITAFDALGNPMPGWRYRGRREFAAGWNSNVHHRRDCAAGDGHGA